MLTLSSAHHLWLYREAVDFRKGFDGLSGIVRDQMGRDPLSGEAFIFLNRKQDRMKLLVWERGGFVLWYKRLEAGRFSFEAGQSGDMQMSYPDLVLLIEGIEKQSTHQKKRYKKEKKSSSIY